MVNIKEIKADNIFSQTSQEGYYYVINPYIGCTHKCVYCYACFMKNFSGHNDENWGDFIDVKRWDGVVRAKRKINNKNILMGTVTDPYDKIEEEYKNTRDILEKLRGTQCILTICTRSDLVLRDLDLIKQLKARVVISINSLDEEFVKKSEETSSIAKRLETLKKLHDEGVYTILNVSPIFPYITDVQKILKAAKDYVDEVWFENLNLRQPYKNKVLQFIADNYSEYIEKYNDIYVEKDNEYWYFLKQDIIDYCVKNKLMYKIDFRHN